MTNICIHKTIEKLKQTFSLPHLYETITLNAIITLSPKQHHPLSKHICTLYFPIIKQRIERQKQNKGTTNGLSLKKNKQT